MHKIVLFLLLNIAVFGVDITVPPDRSTTVTLGEVGDTLTVESDGTISILDETAVIFDNVDQTLVNRGTIAATLTDVVITNTPQDNLSIINHGTISSADGAASIENDVINLQGTNITVTNNGLIAADGVVSSGIFISGNGTSNVQIVNNGTIRSTDAAGSPVEIAANGVILFQNGTLLTTAFVGANGPGIAVRSPTTIFNTGTISATGGLNRGIAFGGSLDVSNSVLVNSGTISSTVNDAIIVFNTSNNISITNSGVIKSTQNFALNLGGQNHTLILLNGSNIQGPITVPDSPLNVSVQRGLNLRLTIDDNSSGFGTLNIDDPFVTVGNTETLATVDPTSFALQPDFLEDLSDVILDVIYKRENPFLYCCYPCQGFWLEALGTSRKRSSETLDIHNSQAGFLSGANHGPFGLAFGGSWGSGYVESHTFTANTASFFGGLTYEAPFCNGFLGSSVIAGYFESRSKRTVMFNLAPGGEEKARTTADGAFLTAEFFAARFLRNYGFFHPLLSGAVRYAGLFLGDYNETGSSADLHVHNRHISLIKPKIQLDFVVSTRSCTLQPFIGAAGRFQVAGIDVDSTLLGQTLNFDSEAKHSLAELLFGFYGSYTRGVSTLFLNVQGMRDTDHSSRILAEGGINLLY